VRRLILPVVIGLAFVGLAQGQGTYLWTWHGNSNFFQASFIVTDAEMQGAPLASPEFINSVSVSSLSGIAYNSKNETLFDGNLNPWTFGFTFLDFNRSTEMFVSAVTFPIGVMAGTIREKPMSGADLYFETGRWTYSAVPEPSPLLLLVLGATAFSGKNARV
jgi:hypothetical protein